MSFSHFDLLPVGVVLAEPSAAYFLQMAVCEPGTILATLRYNWRAIPGRSARCGFVLP
jgi:hypothetical protein